MSIVENIRRIGVFMIAAQTVMHFAAGRQYEKYMKIITGVIILMMFISPIASYSENPANEWQTKVGQLEQQVLSKMQREMPYAVRPVETVAIQQIEEEIRKKLNAAISDRKCSVVDVEIDLGERGESISAGTSGSERSIAFSHVKFTLQSMTAGDGTDEKGDGIIKIKEIAIGSVAEPKTDTQPKEPEDTIQNAEIREYQQLFAQALGITDDKVEVTYDGEW